MSQVPLEGICNVSSETNKSLIHSRDSDNESLISSKDALNCNDQLRHQVHPKTSRDELKRKSEKMLSNGHGSQKSGTQLGKLAYMADNIIANALKKGTLRKSERENSSGKHSKKNSKKDFKESAPTIFKNNRVFWNSKKIEEVREKFKQAKSLILIKMEKDFNELRELITEGKDSQVKEIMLSQEFKRFYKLQILKSNILEHMLRCDRVELLKDILRDDFYRLRHTLIMDVFISYFQQREKELSDRDFVRRIIVGEFYNAKHARIIAFLLSITREYDTLRLLISKHPELHHNDQGSNEQLRDNMCSIEKYYTTLNDCILMGLEWIAIKLVQYHMEFDNLETLDLAIDHNRMIFLEKVWDLYFDLMQPQKSILVKTKTSMTKKVTKNKLNNFFLEINNLFSNVKSKFNKGVIPFTVSYLVKRFCSHSNRQAVKEIIKWNNLDKDKDFLQTLFDKKCFDEISYLLYSERYRNSWERTKEQFKTVILNHELDLILYFLKFRECRTILEDKDIQMCIAHDYMKDGSKIYYGGEMLCYVLLFNWNSDLTRALCLNIDHTVKKNEIVKCHSPILTILLLAEFLILISGERDQNSSRCSTLVNKLLELAKNIQHSNPDEEYIRFLMSQKDTKGRTAFQIAADNSQFLPLLQFPEIGTIIGKMWNGKISQDGYLNASSLFKYLNNSNYGTDPFKFIENYDYSKFYFHQLQVWIDSCMMRFWPESISTIILIFLYNLYIYMLIKDNAVMLSIQDLSKENSACLSILYIYTIWTTILSWNILNQMLFSKLTSRKIKIDIWLLHNLLTMAACLSLYVDVTFFFRDDPNNPSEFAIKSRALLLGLNNLFVWMRIVGVLSIFKEFGPLLRMIYELLVVVAKYILLYALWLICFAAILTSCFSRTNKMFNNFSNSIFNLMGGFIQNFNLNSFSKFTLFGQTILILYIILSGILLINLLVAVLSGTYDNLSIIVDATHRSVIISYLRNYKWDKKYGYLMFLTTPLNILNIITYPISLLLDENKLETYNIVIVKVYYVFYFIPIFLFFILYTLLLIPLCYVKGLISVLVVNRKNFNIFTILFICKWLFAGLLYLIYIFARDAALLIKTAFEQKNLGYISRMKRIRSFLTPEDIKILIQFIHSRKKSQSNEIHEIFSAYLDFECEKLSESVKELYSNREFYSKKSKMEAINKLLFLNKDIESRHQFFKKNVIIIEIFENFLDENTLNKEKHVDLESLKLLFPKTMNIDSRLMKRLIYTDVKSINLALEKLKQNKAQYEQFLMIRKVTSLAQKIDKDIDVTISKFHRMKNVSFFEENIQAKYDAVDMILNIQSESAKDLDDHQKQYLQKLKTVKKSINA